MTSRRDGKGVTLTMMMRVLSVVLLLSLQALTHVSATTMAGAPAIANLPKAHGT